MMHRKFNYIGIDYFAGAGGMSLGAFQAGVTVTLAIEVDAQAARTYSINHPTTQILNTDIRKFEKPEIKHGTPNDIIVMFGGPPCQGFSTSNQKNRHIDNPVNWLFKDYLAHAELIRPDWLVIENVTGIITTENGYFWREIKKELNRLNYTCETWILDASDFGVPQRRRRLFLVCNRNAILLDPPSKTGSEIRFTVEDAISDLPCLPNGARDCVMTYKTPPLNDYQRSLRGASMSCHNNLVTKSNDIIIDRYKAIPRGGNWSNIPANLMSNYRDVSRCHTRIYHRLNPDEPAPVIGNFRKNMLVHPHEDRGLSVREAARLQSFPDWYIFFGSIGYQQQQVGNAVPPRLAKHVFEAIIKAQEDSNEAE